MVFTSKRKYDFIGRLIATATTIISLLLALCVNSAEGVSRFSLRARSFDERDDTTEILRDFMETAIIHINADRFIEAEMVLRDALRRKPDDDITWSVFARMYLKMGRYTDAVAYAGRAVDLNPENLGARVYIAQAHAVQRRYGDLIKLFDNVSLPMDGDHIAPRQLMAEAFVCLGEYDDAIILSAEILRIKPDDMPARAIQALALVGRRGPEDLDNAEELCKEILHRNPLHMKALTVLALIHVARGKLSDAENILTKRIRKRSNETVFVLRRTLRRHLRDKGNVQTGRLIVDKAMITAVAREIWRPVVPGSVKPGRRGASVRKQLQARQGGRRPPRDNNADMTDTTERFDDWKRKQRRGRVSLRRMEKRRSAIARSI